MLEHPLCTAESVEVGVKGEEKDEVDVEEEDVDVKEEDLEEETVEARTQTYTLCEPAQWKCTSTCHKSPTTRIFLYKYLIKLNPFHTISVVNPISSSNSIRPIYNLYVIP